MTSWDWDFSCIMRMSNIKAIYESRIAVCFLIVWVLLMCVCVGVLCLWCVVLQWLLNVLLVLQYLLVVLIVVAAVPLCIDVCCLCCCCSNRC